MELRLVKETGHNLKEVRQMRYTEGLFILSYLTNVEEMKENLRNQA